MGQPVVEGFCAGTIGEFGEQLKPYEPGEPTRHPRTSREDLQCRPTLLLQAVLLLVLTLEGTRSS
jgi:hypothetical protein